MSIGVAKTVVVPNRPSNGRTRRMHQHTCRAIGSRYGRSGGADTVTSLPLTACCGYARAGEPAGKMVSTTATTPHGRPPAPLPSRSRQSCAAATRGPTLAGQWVPSRSLRSALLHAARDNSSSVRRLPRLAYRPRAGTPPLGLFLCLVRSPADAPCVSYTCSASGLHTTWRPGPRRMVCPLGPFLCPVRASRCHFESSSQPQSAWHPSSTTPRWSAPRANSARPGRCEGRFLDGTQSRCGDLQPPPQRIARALRRQEMAASLAFEAAADRLIRRAKK